MGRSFPSDSLACRIRAPRGRGWSRTAPCQRPGRESPRRSISAGALPPSAPSAHGPPTSSRRSPCDNHLSPRGNARPDPGEREKVYIEKNNNKFKSGKRQNLSPGVWWGRQGNRIPNNKLSQYLGPSVHMWQARAWALWFGSVQ